MSTPIAVVIPTFGRASRLSEVAENVVENSKNPVTVVFVVEPSDTESMHAALCATRVVNARTANYAGAMNSAFDWLAQHRPDVRYVLAAADDLEFHPGWDTELLAAADANPELRVFGTNDLGNEYVLTGKHATHYLIDRRYVDEVGGTMDLGPGIAFFEGYDHNYTDTEFIGVAKARGVFTPVLTSVVEHLHFLFGKAHNDETYDRGFRHIQEDEQVYTERKRQWVHLLAADDTL